MTISNTTIQPSTWSLESFEEFRYVDDQLSGLRRTQGIVWNADAKEWVTSWQFGLARETEDFKFLQTTGSIDLSTVTPITGIPKELADMGFDHIGDIDYANGKLYISLDSEAGDYQNGHVAIFNASDLSYTGELHELVGAPTNPHNDVASWVAVDAAAGLGYGKEWQNGNTINVYNLNDWSFKGTITMDQNLKNIQGAKVFDGKLYFSAHDSTKGVYTVDLQTGHVEKLFDIPQAANAGNETEGLAVRATANGGIEIFVQMIHAPKGDEFADDYVRMYHYVTGGEAPAPVSLAHTWTVTTANDTTNPDDFSLTLREAIAKASAGDTITFDASLAGKTITLDGAALDLAKSLTIKGDIIIDGNNLATTIHVTAGHVTLDGLTVIRAAGDAILVDTGATLTFIHGSTATPGTAGDDVQTGSDLADTIDGGNGDDIINGMGGGDTLSGGAGKDAIIGGLGNDVIDGGAGDDTLIGNEGNDQLTGGDGADLMDGGEGDDGLTGGNGSDTYVYSTGSGSDTIVEGAGLAGDQDRLFLDDAVAGDVVIHRHGSDLEINIGGETITIKGQLSGGGVEVISFADGTALVGDQILAAVVNRGPVAAATASATGNEDAQILGQIVASDADEDQLTYGVKTGFGPAHGALLLDAATGRWSYNPTADYNGADSFTVIVSDGHGGTVEQVVNLTVAPVNDGPIAVDDIGSATESAAKVFDLLANDHDIDGNALSLSGFTVDGVAGLELSADAAKAAFSIVDGKLAFAPGSLFAGLHDGEHATLTLSYTVSDGTHSDTGSFTLTVNGEGQLQNIIIGTEGSNILIGTDGDDAITAYGGGDYAFGRDGADVIDGGDGNDYLFGGIDDDVINGGDGNDTLFGDAGTDVLIGDKGNDRMVGGAGADTFVFRSGFGHDTVMDFGAGDVVDLSTTDFTDFADLADHLSDTALGLTLTLDDGSTLTLADIDKAHVTADQFHFTA